MSILVFTYGGSASNQLNLEPQIAGWNICVPTQGVVPTDFNSIERAASRLCTATSVMMKKIFSPLFSLIFNTTAWSNPIWGSVFCNERITKKNSWFGTLYSRPWLPAFHIPYRIWFHWRWLSLYLGLMSPTHFCDVNGSRRTYPAFRTYTARIIDKSTASIHALLLVVLNAHP